MVNRVKVLPGIKDLPEHIRKNFRNEFIRFVMKQVANLQSPWMNPDVDALQAMYQIVYPIFPARIRHSDAVFNPVSNSSPAILSNLDVIHQTTTSLAGLRNNLASTAIAAVQRHVVSVFRKKRLETIEGRVNYIAQLFKSKNDDPIIWREYVEGNIQNHPEVGGYKTVCFHLHPLLSSAKRLRQTRRGAFQSDPILETLLSYYASSGIMEPPPHEDPGVGNRPLGILALTAAAVGFI